MKGNEYYVSLYVNGGVAITEQYYGCGPRQLSRYSDSLRTGRSGDRIPVGARFSAPVQTGPGAHPAYYTMVTGSFSGVKRPGRGRDHPTPSIAEVKDRVGLYLYSFVAYSMVNL